MLLLHTCFFFGGGISAIFIHVGFQLKISNPCRRFFGTARKGFAVCMHPCFRRWVPRKPCSSKLKKRGRGHENFRWWLKFLEHDLNIIFPWSFVFYLTLYLKRWSMIFFFYQFLHVASYWLHIFASQMVLVGSLPWFPKKTQVRPENLSLFRGTRIADVPPRQII